MSPSEMTDAQFSVLMKLDDAHRAAVFMARALRDIFNDVGNLPEVRAAFDKVEMCVSDYEGREPDDIYDEMDEELKP